MMMMKRESNSKDFIDECKQYNRKKNMTYDGKHANETDNDDIVMVMITMIKIMMSMMIMVMIKL